VAEPGKRRETRKRYWNHLRRTFVTLGAILLVAVTIGLASEICLQAFTLGPGGFASDYVSLRATFSLALVSLQVALSIVGALVAAPVLVAHFLHDLHGTSTVNEAHDRLNQLLFGALGVRQKVSVKQGKVASEENNVVERVGGPASLTVYGDSAVVTEQGGSLKRVLTAGTHSLDRYERIWETVDLRPQRWVREVFALTKEGIPISCDVDVLFRINASVENQGPEHRASSTGNQATVLRAAASTWVRKDGKITQTINWTERVAALVENALRDILATYRLDWLIKAPQSGQEHPRDEIHERLEVTLEGHLDRLGVELLDVDLGQMQVKVQDEDGDEDQQTSDTLSDIISGQWIDAWHADWKAQALTSRAEGEAELLRMDTARIEAQAEMIIGLAEILQPMVTDESASEPYVLALRLVEALRWMSYDPSTRDYMPPEAMRTLKRLRKLLDSEATVQEPGAPSEEGGGEA